MNPELSVVLIAYNKEKEIPLILEGFRRQREADFPWEMIVVDDGSSDGTVAALSRHGKGLPILIHALPHGGNRNLLRNHGMNAARGRRIAFLDGDIVPGPLFLATHGRERDEADVLLAPRSNLGAGSWVEASAPLLEKDLRYLDFGAEAADEREPHFHLAPLDSQPHPWRFLHSHNFSCSAERIRALRGFDPDLRHWGADDLELGYRLQASGARLVWAPEAGGHHLHHPSGGTRERYWLNLDLFHGKFPRPEVELLYLEDRLQPAESLAAFRACQGNPDFRVRLADDWSRWELSGRILRIQVDAAFGEAALGIGIKPFARAEPADFCLVSARLASLGAIPFLAILTEAGRAAGRALIVGECADLAPVLEEIRSANPRRAFQACPAGREYDPEGGAGLPPIAFHQHNLLDPFCQNHAFRSLAGELLNGKGAEAFMLSRLESVETNDRYLRIDAPVRIPSPFLFDGPIFVFHPLWNTEEGNRFRDPIRVFWGDIAFKEEGVFQAIHRTYDLLLFRTGEDRERYLRIIPDPKPNHILGPYMPGHFKPAPAKAKGNPGLDIFRIIVVAKYADDRLGIESILEAYAHAFTDADPVRLEIHLGASHEYAMCNPYLAPSRNARISEWCNRSQALFDQAVERKSASLSRRLGARLPDCSIHRGDMDAEGLSDLFSGADLLVNAQHFSITPWEVLAALRCGLRVLCPDHLAEFGDIAMGTARLMPSRPYPAGHGDYRLAPMQGPLPSVAPLSIYRRVDADAIAAGLRSAFADPVGKPAGAPHAGNGDTAGRLLGILETFARTRNQPGQAPVESASMAASM